MFNRMIGDYSAFFKNKQGMFEGIKKTFKPRWLRRRCPLYGHY